MEEKWAVIEKAKKDMDAQFAEAISIMKESIIKLDEAEQEWQKISYSQDDAPLIKAVAIAKANNDASVAYVNYLTQVHAAIYGAIYGN